MARSMGREMSDTCSSSTPPSTSTMVSCMRLLASLSFLNFSSAGWLTMLERIFTIVPVFWGPCSALHRPYIEFAHT